MGNAEHETPVGRAPAQTTEELEARVLAADIAGVTLALQKVVRAAEQAGDAGGRLASQELGPLLRELADLSHEHARHFESRQRAEHQTHRDLVAIRDEIRRARFGPWNVAGLVIAAGTAVLGIMTNTLPFTGPIAIAIAGAAGVLRRRQRSE